MDILAHLLEEAPPKIEIASPRACFDALQASDERFTASSDRAAAGGFMADRLGYAFLAGYRAALMKLDPSLSRASLCATEEGSAHPRAIRTVLLQEANGYVLRGTKTFATLASAADTLLVVASTGRDGTRDRNLLRAVRIPATRSGIAIRDRPPLAFAPEIPHATVELANVYVAGDEILEGDGYDGVLKPFRTIEDVHVSAAWLACVIRMLRDADTRDELVELAIAGILSLREIAERDPSTPECHVALAGVLDAMAPLAALNEADFAGCDEVTRSRWQRDKPLLEVAGMARKLRREAAWARISRRHRKR